MSSSVEKAVVFQSAASLHNAAVTSTSNSLGVDITDYTGIVEVAVAIPVASGTTPTLDIVLQSSATSGGTYAAAVKTDGTSAAFTQKTAAATVERILVDTASLNKFVRLAFTAGGTSPSFAVSAVLRGVKKIV